jgi:hypothetical protein
MQVNLQLMDTEWIMYIHDLALKCTIEVARGSDHPAPRVLGSTWSWVNIPTKYIDSLESIMLHFVDTPQDYCFRSRPNSSYVEYLNTQFG